MLLKRTEGWRLNDQKSLVETQLNKGTDIYLPLRHYMLCVFPFSPYISVFFIIGVLCLLHLQADGCVVNLVRSSSWLTYATRALLVGSHTLRMIEVLLIGIELRHLLAECRLEVSRWLSGWSGNSWFTEFFSWWSMVQVSGLTLCWFVSSEAPGRTPQQTISYYFYSVCQLSDIRVNSVVIISH